MRPQPFLFGGFHREKQWAVLELWRLMQSVLSGVSTIGTSWKHDSKKPQKAWRSTCDLVHWLCRLGTVCGWAQSRAGCRTRLEFAVLLPDMLLPHAANRDYTNFFHKRSVLTSLCHYHSTPFGNLSRTVKGQLFEHAIVKCIALERHMLSFFQDSLTLKLLSSFELCSCCDSGCLCV